MIYLIFNFYSKFMYLNHKTNCQTGDPITAEDWNHLASDVNELGTGGGNGSSSGGNVSISNDTVTDPSAGVSIVTGVDQVGTTKVIELTKKKKGVNTTIVSGNNINLEPRESVDSTKGGNISFKPGDDIEFCSHHRVADNQDEVSIKVIDGDDNPVKLQLNAASMTLTTKDKIGNDANVFDININSGKNTKGYLKVRAQAIDLRCEDHGGVALQPKGEDSDHHMNKIKFEHGGGDGLEFGTFNTEKSSLYTNEYRFKKDGVIKLSTRTTEVSDKYDNSDETTHYKYVKAADDFYDNIDNNDPTCTWEDVVKGSSQIKNLVTRFELDDLCNYYEIGAGGNLSGQKLTLNQFNNLKAIYPVIYGDTSMYTVSYLDENMFKAGEIVKHLDLMDNAELNYRNDGSFSGSLDPLDFESTLNNISDNTMFAIYINQNCVWVCRKRTVDPRFVVNGKLLMLNDIITLVDYFKMGAGISQGPWANS